MRKKYEVRIKPGGAAGSRNGSSGARPRPSRSRPAKRRIPAKIRGHRTSCRTAVRKREAGKQEAAQPVSIDFQNYPFRGGRLTSKSDIYHVEEAFLKMIDLIILASCRARLRRFARACRTSRPRTSGESGAR